MSKTSRSLARFFLLSIKLYKRIAAPLLSKNIVPQSSKKQKNNGSMDSTLKDSFLIQQEIAPTNRKRTENVFTLSVLFS